MHGAAVGFYCAVVDRFDLSVLTCRTTVRGTQADFNQRAERLRTWLFALNLGSVDDWQRESESRTAGPMGICP